MIEKLKQLDDIDKKLELDMMNFDLKQPLKNPKTKDLKGIKVTKQMILTSTNCDELSQVKGCIL